MKWNLFNHKGQLIGTTEADSKEEAEQGCHNCTGIQVTAETPKPKVILPPDPPKKSGF